MGSPSDGRARHRLFPADGAAPPRHVAFTTSLPDAYGDLEADPLALVLDIPAPRQPVDEPTTEWPLMGSPVDAPTVAIRHIVMPPADDDALYEQIYGSPSRSQSARWGFVLGGAVVAACTAYIAVAGIGALNRDPGSPANSALTGPRPAVTFSVSAVPPGTSTEPARAAPVARAVHGAGAIAPAAAPDAVIADAVVVEDDAAPAADPVEDARDQRVRDSRRGAEQTPRVATPPSGGPTPAPGTSTGSQPPPGPNPGTPSTPVVVPTT